MARRKNYNPKLITHDGLTMTALEWAEHIGISRSRLYNRLKAWPLAEALSRDKQTGHNRLNGPRIPVSAH